MPSWLKAMILIAVLQTMEERAREAGAIPNRIRFWNVDNLRVFFCTGTSNRRAEFLAEAGIACNYSVFIGESAVPVRREQVRFAHDGVSIIHGIRRDETEFGLWDMRLQESSEHLTSTDIAQLVWVLADQQSWDDQQHNGNMFLMRKMLTM